MSDLILYTTDDGRSQIKLRAEQQTVRLTQKEMADLFATTRHNIFEDKELREGSVVKESLTVPIEGGGYVRHQA
jgi:hypothetical protein